MNAWAAGTLDADMEGTLDLKRSPRGADGEVCCDFTTLSSDWSATACRLHKVRVAVWPTYC